MGEWVASGKVKSHETVVDGLEKMPDAFLGLFTGANTAKMLVRV
jgi:NADPH-dependent curcumin reductase CurA